MGEYGCMVLCGNFHTTPEQGQGQHLLSPIVLVVVLVPAIKQSMQGMVKVNTWVFILRRYNGTYTQARGH